MEAATRLNGVGPLFMALVFRATDGDLALLMASSRESRRTVESLVFHIITPRVNDTGFNLVFERYVQTEKPAP